MHELNLKHATIDDCSSIYSLLSPYYDEGLILPRSKDNILLSIDSFLIGSYCGANVGCISVKDYTNGLYEIRSLAVSKQFEGKGIGYSLISYAVTYIQEYLNAWRIFALTRRPNIFIRAGFEIVSKDLFPEKVWNDCSKCIRLHSCDEVAMQKLLN